MKAIERKTGQPQISGKNVAAASDVAGVKGLMRGLAAKRKPKPKEQETT